jgi:glycosyltransferase involved in cell wall biosynthesis
MARPSLTLFLPAWNEEEYVERTVARAKVVLDRLSDDWEIIVVNDASTDRTREIAEGLGQKDARIRCVSHEVNQELERALHLMDYLEADMICAFRFDRTSEGPKRIVYSFVYNFLIRQLFDVHMKDINFSFKVVHRRVLEAIDLKSQGSFIDAELVIKAIRSGFKVFQMGVDYFPRTRGVSTLASPSVIAKIIRELGSLYGDVKNPRPPARPVRLPRDVTAFPSRKAAGS